MNYFYKDKKISEKHKTSLSVWQVYVRSCCNHWPWCKFMEFPGLLVPMLLFEVPCVKQSWCMTGSVFACAVGEQRINTRPDVYFLLYRQSYSLIA